MLLFSVVVSTLEEIVLSSMKENGQVQILRIMKKLNLHVVTVNVI